MALRCHKYMLWVAFLASILVAAKACMKQEKYAQSSCTTKAIHRVDTDNGGKPTIIGQTTKWLMSQRLTNGSWPAKWLHSNIGRYILALQLANGDWMNDVQNLLSIKQFHIEFLGEILRREGINKVKAGVIAEAVLALRATCSDPKDFHSINLVDTLDGMLKKYPSQEFDYHYYPYAMSIIALCSAGIKVNKTFVGVLQRAVRGKGHYELQTDELAVSLMALTCVKNQSNTTPHIRHGIEKLKSQLSGRRHNANSLALAIQTIKGYHPQWRHTNAIRKLLSYQQPDGSFGHPYNTVQVLPALALRSYYQLGHIKCNMQHRGRDTGLRKNNFTRDGNMMVTKIYVVYENNTEEVYETRIPKSTNLYQILVMLKGASAFRFTADSSSLGHYIGSLNGIQANHASHNYWKISHRGTGKKFSLGVDDIFPTNKDHIVFKYGRHY